MKRHNHYKKYSLDCSLIKNWIPLQGMAFSNKIGFVFLSKRDGYEQIRIFQLDF